MRNPSDEAGVAPCLWLSEKSSEPLREPLADALVAQDDFLDRLNDDQRHGLGPYVEYRMGRGVVHDLGVDDDLDHVGVGVVEL